MSKKQQLSTDIPQVSTDTVTTVFQQIEVQDIEISEPILKDIIEDTYESQDSLRGGDLTSLHTMKSNFRELKKSSLNKKSNNPEQRVMDYGP